MGRGRLGVSNARIMAVLPAGIDAWEAAEFAAGYAGFGATGMIATKLDMARRLGGVLSAAMPDGADWKSAPAPGGGRAGSGRRRNALARRLGAIPRAHPPGRPEE